VRVNPSPVKPAYPDEIRPEPERSLLDLTGQGLGAGVMNPCPLRGLAGHHGLAARNYRGHGFHEGHGGFAGVGLGGIEEPEEGAPPARPVKGPVLQVIARPVLYRSGNSPTVYRSVYTLIPSGPVEHGVSLIEPLDVSFDVFLFPLLKGEFFHGSILHAPKSVPGYRSSPLKEWYFKRFNPIWQPVEHGSPR